MFGSLAGIRVVDVTMSVAGPFATLILADLGADVIKVERPGVGDDTRSWGPPFWEGESCHFSALNRNKRSVELDLKDPEGAAHFRELLATADVFVQNLRPGSLAKLGFGYDEVAAINPRLIYCDMTGYGSDGPLASSPAYDPLMQAFSGLMSLTGEDGRPPSRIPVSVLDQGTGMWTAIAVLDALRTRDRTGLGTHLETSLLSTALMWLPGQFTGYFAAGEVPKRLGSGTVGIYPYAAFPTATGHVIIAAGNQNLWTRLCTAVDRTELLSDPRFDQNADRVDHRDELFAELSATLTKHDSDHWVSVLGAAGVPITPIQTLDEVAAHVQVAAIGAFQQVPHPRIPGYTSIALPVRGPDGRPEFRMAPPLLGEHTDEILAELAARRKDVEK